MSEQTKAEIDELLAESYADLRRVARGYMANERQGHTLQPTELVHAAYQRVLKLKKRHYEDREVFFRVVTSFMRRQLVDHARGRVADKRGGGIPKVEFNEELPAAAPEDSDSGMDGFLDRLGDALTALRTEDERAARAIELRFLGRLTIEQTAKELGVSTGTVKRDVEFGQAWLARWLKTSSPGEA